MNKQSYRNLRILFPYYTNSHFPVNKAIMLSHRRINIAVTGTQNKIVSENQCLTFTNTKSFESFVGPIIESLNDFYPLKNRSSIATTLLHVLHFALVLPLIVTTSCYDYIHNNGLTYKLPVGIAKMLDSVCVRTIKHSTVGNAGSLIGVVETTYNLPGVISFLKSHYLVVKADDNGNRYSQDLESLSRFLGTVGYSIYPSELYNVINSLVITLESYLTDEHILNYGMMLETVTRLSGCIVKLPYINYSTTYSSTETIGIYKFRNSGRENIYHVTPRGWSSTTQPGQQIIFIYLALFKPTFVTNDLVAVNINAEDLNLDISQHDTLSVLRALYSFQASPVIHNSLDESTVTNNPNLSTLADNLDGKGNAGGNSRLFHSFSSAKSKQSFANQYNRCHIWCSDPLTLTFADAIPHWLE